ncbi:leucine-rich repeats and immunoglobulin-like domains protein 3 [Halyomorpha halys]|uniref:leucine-rich repeats and immunoglobulin-like domains protein 3 n=1 Tax=Halyomorpha halys TaxID=286706 RepID=UPI0006D4DD51|nr:leucine-rich repeat-containing protein 15-like [Halyomorpha halys]
MHIHGLILLCLLYGVLTKHCPEKCSCYRDKVNCAGRSLSSLDEYDLHLIQSFDHVDISRNKFTIFPLLDAKFINASKNNFQLFPDIINGVQSLSLRYNQMRDVLSENCPVSLRSLDLSENPIKTINIACDGLAVLDLSHCDIEILPETFLKKLSSLEILNIGDNPLRKISDLVSFSLQELRIQRTQFRVLKPTALTGLTKLKFLDLSGNKHMRILDFHTNAEILIAQNCSLDSVDFSGMPNLRTAVVDHNVINRIHFLNSLVELHASNNLITYIDLHSLKIADLSYNAISALKLRPMDWLNITGNQIQNLKLVSMNLLEASNCKLKSIEINRVNIPTLNISHNELEHFPGGMSATILDVSYNRLSTFKSQINGIAEIHLSGNRLVLAEDVIAQGKMHLNDNPWTCDCRMDHLYRLAEDANNLLCAHPKNVSGKTWADACYRSRIPRWMLKHPYIPFIISTTLLFLAIFCFYWIRKMLDTPHLRSGEEEENNHVVETVLPQIVINDQLPSYEEALLMPGIARKVNVVTQTRSYEVLSRRLSSNSI